MIRQLRFIWMLFKLKLSHMMVFRLSFFGAFFVDGTMFAVQLLMFSAIYSKVDTIGSFGYGEMVFFTGTFSMLNAVNMVIYFFGLVGVPGKIKNGDLDMYVTKPVSPLLRLTFENIDIGSIPLVIASAAIIVYGAGQMDVVITAWKVIGYVLLLVVMVVLYYDVELILRTVPFLVISATSVERLEELLVLNMKVPGVLFKGVFKVLFYFFLPYGLMATVPTQFFADTLAPLGLAYALGVSVLFTWFAMWFWRFGLSRYKSASS